MILFLTVSSPLCSQQLYGFERFGKDEDSWEYNLNIVPMHSDVFELITVSSPSGTNKWRIMAIPYQSNNNLLSEDTAYIEHDSAQLALGWRSSSFRASDTSVVVVGTYQYSDVDAMFIELNSITRQVSKLVTFPRDKFNQFNQGMFLGDGNYMFFGTNSDYQYPGEFWLVKTTTIGEIIWETHYGTDEYETGIRISPSLDGGYYLLGESRGYGPYQPNYSDALLIKTDSLGNELWRTHWGGYYGDCAWNVEPTPDGGVVVCGCLGDDPNDEIVYGYIRKMNDEGDLVWERVFERNEENDGRMPRVFNMCRVMNNGNIVVAGWGYQDRGDTTISRVAPWVVIVNENGDLLMSRSYTSILGDQSAAVFQDIRSTPDGGFIAGGTYYPKQGDTGNQDAFILKLDERGCEYPECMPPLVVEQLEKNAVVFTAYPNPFSDAITFNTSGQQGLLEIYDLQGRLLTQFQTQAAGHTVYMASNLDAGVYVVGFTNKAGQRAVTRVVKQ